nr:uncharacterized protein SPBC8E4.02c [Schizosaccharomyces pombe]O42886.1 RecName: Full=Uncharacterized protein C8E4.02c [Schizosaccharomyces pombe 972h-]CAA16995.1 sequence orphan [Schizosaccharomyces pombe]|eukprot:NP_596845.1 uncharacterized protein SPBC8E4.02c [Schizosaccharomyces pombe]
MAAFPFAEFNGSGSMHALLMSILSKKSYHPTSYRVGGYRNQLIRVFCVWACIELHSINPWYSGMYTFETGRLLVLKQRHRVLSMELKKPNSSTIKPCFTWANSVLYNDILIFIFANFILNAYRIEFSAV